MTESFNRLFILDPDTAGGSGDEIGLFTEDRGVKVQIDRCVIRRCSV